MNPPPDLVRLARAAAAPLFGRESEPLPHALVERAHEHHIAPLLYIATSDPALADTYERNAQAQREAHAWLARIAARFADADVEWLVLGGQPQAALLYPDPAWRAASAIDILLAPGARSTAARLLGKEGLRRTGSAAPAARDLARAGLQVPRALSFTEPSGGQTVHCHEHLFFAGSAIAEALGADFTPRQARDIPSPPLGPALALSVLLRGAARRWSKLKWVIDFAALLHRLDAAGQTALIDIVERIDAVPAAAASLRLQQTLFGELPATLTAWLERQTAAEIAVRHDLYLPALDDSEVSDTRIVAPATQRRTLRHDRLPSLAGMVRRSLGWAAPPREPGRYQRATATRADRYPLVFGFAQAALAGGKDLRLLSFGCATGEEVFTLRDYFPDARIKGIDIDAGCIAAAEAARERRGDDKLSFAVAASTESEQDESLDAIFAMAVFRDPALDPSDVTRNEGSLRFADFARAVRDFARCLKPGGLLFIAHGNFRFADTATATGFDTVLHADPPRSGRHPGLFGADDRRVSGLYRAVGFRRRGTPA